ncbi:hypothetical protein NP493_677g00010 [Ridgeia piscesae]|uniref:Integrase catalytic domain-containing protein n=1 Tax=Ridgeia piscesae TaxID=27915 RepID=A0AAD9NN57_RIDPI|nr:hypothetical protein NP493_677g00010 [Ridgeia piscesae]
MDKLKPPHELKIAGGNLADRWERFLERFRWYLAAVGEDGSEDKKKVAILLTVAGAEAQKVFRTFTYEPAKAAVGNQPAVPAETAEQFNTVVRKFTEFCVPRKNVIYERYVFHTRVQGEVDKKKQRKRRGTSHKFRKCPAWRATCDKCGGRNHYASKCLTRRVQVVGVDNDSTGDKGGFFVSAIHNNPQQCEWIALLTVCDSLVPLKVDSGAQVNILSLSDYEGLASKPKLLTERRAKLKTYNEENIETLGICIATVNHMGKKHRLQFVVISNGRQSLIGASDSERLGLVRRECGIRKVCTVKENGVLTSAEIKKEYPDIFKGLGCLEGTCKIHLRQNCVPSVYPARKVLQSQKQKLKKELDRLVQTEVLVKAERPTDWVLPLVIVEKPNGDLRLCLDPMDLNEYIRREHYHLPHRSEILSEMADARYFTKMDASQGFNQIQLDEESTQLWPNFVPNLTVKTTALRQLLLEKNDWQWEAEQAKEWQDIKDFFTTEPLLKFYDPARRSKISSDASKDGLGAVLLQEHDGNWLPVAFISHAMTSAEKNYAQIEKELLGLVFACEKFHEYVYGVTVIGETDHKPLVSLHKKNLCDLTPRLQQMMQRLRRYDLKKLEFKPGKYLIVADTLSRAFDRSVKKSNTEDEIKAHVDMIRQNAQVSGPMWEKIATHTKDDEELKDVLNAVHFGWESDHAQSLKPYYHFRGDITEIDGVLVKGPKVIIPKTLQGDMLKKIHEGNLDNGPQFSSREFRQFAMQYGFKHVTSSPEYTQSNGKAEKAVQIVKRLLKKANENYEDPYLALLNYRTSPLSGSDRSPGEISMNRKLRTKLTSAEEHVTMHKLPDIKQKRYYDHGSNQLKPLETTDTVRVRGDGVWSEKAQVLARVAPNSYLVELGRGRRLRRNRRHLLKTQERFVPVHDDDDGEKEVCVDHPSGGATASTNQSAVTPEAAQSSHSTDQSQPVSTMSDVRTTRSGRIIKLPSRYVHD